MDINQLDSLMAVIGLGGGLIAVTVLLALAARSRRSADDRAERVGHRAAVNPAQLVDGEREAVLHL